MLEVQSAAMLSNKVAAKLENSTYLPGLENSVQKWNINVLISNFYIKNA